MLDFALDYIAKGWSVIPLAVGTKTPAIKLTGYLAGTDRLGEAEARGYWGRENGGPQRFGIGIVTGAPSRLAVVDIDPRNGGDLNLGADFGIVAAVETGGGGAHLYCKMPDGADWRCGKTSKPGVDLKANGGYVVAPPSLHPSGGVYRWLMDTSQAPLGTVPAWALEGLASSSSPWISGSRSAEFEKELDSPSALPGTLNDMRARLAGHLARLGGDEGDAIGRLLAWGRVVAPGDPRMEYETTEVVRRMYDKEAAKPPVPPPIPGVLDDIGGDVCVADVACRPVDWLWPGRIAFNKVTMLDGAPDSTKTLMAVDIAARLSNGQPFYGSPGRAYKPANTLIVSYEDDIGDTLRPRLEAAGADLRRIFAYHLSDTPMLPSQARALCKVIQARDIRLVIIDPLMAAIEAKHNANADQEVRAALRPIIAFAQKYRVAVILIRHIGKGEASKSDMNKGLGAVGIGGLARAGYLLKSEGSEPGYRQLICYKNNLAPKPETIEYEVVITDGRPHIIWKGTAPKVLAEAPETLAERAAAFIRGRLASGPVDSDVMRAALAEAFPKIGSGTITSACAMSGVVRDLRGTPWHLR